MVSVEKAVVARIHREGKNFEVLVDSEMALEFRRGKPFSIENILAVRQVFTDSKKGERPTSSEEQKAFGTSDILKIAEFILKHGEIQLTTEQRRKLLEEKRKQVANIISKQGIDPKTKLPHPPQRILNAMEQAHINLDPFKPAENQVEDVLKKIESIIPISIERIQVAVKVPMEYAGKAAAAIRSLTVIKQEEWKGDGWYALLEIPAGMQAEIYSKLNDLTHGKVDVKAMKK